MIDKTRILLDKAAAITEHGEDKMSSTARAERRFSLEADAEKCFAALREKLFRIEKWNAHSGLTSYELFDEAGNTAAGARAKIGDFIKITLAGSGKSDWVKIIEIDDASDEIIITVQPSHNPTENQPDTSVISHFFNRESTNNFCLQRSGETVNFCVVGLDEKTNTQNTNNILETARNAATANIGHYLGIQKSEWMLFCTNFLEIEPEK